MPPEMQIVKDICDFFAAQLAKPLRFHFGDVLLKSEVDSDLSSSQYSRWLVPIMSDKEEEIANATENLIQTFEASLVVVAKRASDCVEELLDILRRVYVSSEGIAGIHDAPVEIVDGTLGTLRLHRFEPANNRIKLSATEWEGNWVIEQDVIISAEKN